MNRLHSKTQDNMATRAQKCDESIIRVQYMSWTDFKVIFW